MLYFVVCVVLVVMYMRDLCFFFFIVFFFKQKTAYEMRISDWSSDVCSSDLEAPELQPQAQGFDESLAILAGAAMFLREDDPDSVNAKLPWDPIDRFIWANLRHAVTFNGSKRFHPQGHLPDSFADHAIEAIEANRTRPFLLYPALHPPPPPPPAHTP